MDVEAITDCLCSMARLTRLEVRSKEAMEAIIVAAAAISKLVAVSELMIP
jgi:hypothetical protein